MVTMNGYRTELNRIGTITVSDAGALLSEKIATRQAVVSVVGLGYVGLPLMVAFAEAGFRVVGIDVDKRKVAGLNAGQSHVSDVPSERLAGLVMPLSSIHRRPRLAGIARGADSILANGDPETLTKMPARGACGTGAPDLARVFLAQIAQHRLAHFLIPDDERQQALSVSHDRSRIDSSPLVMLARAPCVARIAFSPACVTV